MAISKKLSVGLAFAVGTIFAADAQSISNAGNGQQAPGFVDCTNVGVEYQEDPTLTKAEQLARMDAALLSSLNRFDACQSAKENSDSGGSTDGGGSNGGATGGGASVASSDMTGTEKSTEGQQTEGTSTSSSWGDVASAGNGVPGEDTPMEGAEGQAASRSNGKIPEDIPPADNDSILEAQIRQAAMNEKDPAVREKLWDEYRKYKGLPQKN